jgi:RimJ/RimL family protein N-acetyltransferase
MIETDRLILREMRDEDAEPLLAIFSDPIAMEYFGNTFGRERMNAWVQSNADHRAKHGFSLLTVVLKDGGEVIGDCGLETTEIDGDLVVGVGFDFVRRHWNNGYATEAASAVLDHGFIDYGFPKISAWIDPENAASQRVAEKIGMTREKLVPRGGKHYAIYSILKEIWERRRRLV